MNVAAARADNGGKQGVNFPGEPHDHAETDARARQARTCGLMLQSLRDDHMLQRLRYVSGLEQQFFRELENFIVRAP